VIVVVIVVVVTFANQPLFFLGCGLKASCSPLQSSHCDLLKINNYLF